MTILYIRPSAEAYRVTAVFPSTLEGIKACNEYCEAHPKEGVLADTAGTREQHGFVFIASGEDFGIPIAEARKLGPVITVYGMNALKPEEVALVEAFLEASK